MKFALKARFYKSFNYKNDYLFLVIFAVIVCIPILFNYRFVKDDTGNVVVFYEFLQNHSIPRTLALVGSNEWLGYIPRSFFLTWWIQIGLIKIFGIPDLMKATVTFACFAALVHTLNALLIYKLSNYLIKRPSLAIAAATTYLALPHATVDYMLSNNWFFLLPLFFCLIFLDVLLRRPPGDYKTTISLIFLLSCTMFSGEQLLAVPYIIGGLVTIFFLINKKYITLRRSRLIQGVLVYGSGLLIFIIYTKILSRSPKPLSSESVWSKNIFDLPSLFKNNWTETLFSYNRKLFEMLTEFLVPTSWIYGKAGVSVSIGTTVLCAIACASYAFYRYINNFPTNRLPFSLGIKSLFFLSVALFSVMLPMYFASLTGMRLGPEDRYLFVPATLLGLMIIVLVDMLIANSFFKSTIYGAMLIYCLFLTLHITLDVWRTQATLDKRLWESVDVALLESPDFILTINNDTYPSHRGLQRPYLSVGWTDFQADWGVTSLLRYRKKKIILIQNVAIDGKGELVAIGYWGARFSTTADKIQVIYFDDAASMAETLKGEVSVFSFSEYLKVSADSKIPNRVIVER